MVGWAGPVGAPGLMGIVDEDVARVRESADIVQIVSAHTQLKRVGRSWSGLCPFHGEKSPSFSVNAEKGVYYCFGCQAKGDVISFVRDIEHLDFAGAIELLAAKLGMALRYTDANEGEGRKQRSKLRDALSAAVDWYHQRLLTAPDAGAARRYLRDRGLDGDLVREYRIGWAPDDWDQLARSLKVDRKVFVDAGLGFVNKRDRVQDFFRGRVLFPIFDQQGEPVGFGGRKMPGADGPKYRNTPETKLYAKSKVLYGLNWAKEQVVHAGEVIICEGYTDVIGFARVGVPRAVATCGTALTDEHVRLLQRFAPKLVLAFDPDAAGQAAAERVYEWEQKHGVEVAVAVLPAGQDPGDLAGSDPDRLRQAVEQATPFLGFRVQRALDAGDLRSPEGRGRAAEAALAMIAEHPSDLVRDQYLMEVADRCRLDPDRLRSVLRRGGRPRVAAPVAPARRSGVNTPEAEAIRLTIATPAEMLPLLDEVLFDDHEMLGAYRVLRDVGGDVHAAVDVADPATADLLARLAVEETDAEAGDVRRLLLWRKAESVKLELEAEMRHADDVLAYAESIGWLKRQIEAVQPDAPLDGAAEDELLAWLGHRAEEPS
ncbi:MAG: dnaG [Acidimicrobiales bacterium]|nr:dnaG [Acidimicrobiales bacterium]